ncbi:MAG: hypothetical protein M1828_005130 [Chrysothrix sp. TS-e1954]|nr:MAG: hypothetical protein M1828_005130 [Chrysothrix sp. TS-e1954]
MSPVQAAFIEYQNCLRTLDSNVNASLPHRLQFVPLFVDAKFDTKSSRHMLNVTYYGNVTGQDFPAHLPPSTDNGYWDDDQETNGKILNVTHGTHSRITTLLYSLNVLTYTPYSSPGSIFCNSTDPGTTCPIKPAFGLNLSDPTARRQLPSFQIGYDMSSSYRFTAIDSEVHIQTQSTESEERIYIGCIAATITPSLGNTISDLVGYLPVVVLAFVAIATVAAAVFSPWGTTDVFKATSNYGRDEDLLRLVTPGFGDCLQYIQFVVLAGSLSLNYPGYFQPVVSQVGWSALMFNQSFVSHNDGVSSLEDGVYAPNGAYGLTRMRQLIGMSQDYDSWAGVVIWTLVIIAVIVVICQLGFLLQWVLKALANNAEEDLRRKNWPFTGGNLVRVVCNFFLLPIVALSMFQLVIAGSSPAVVTALSVVLLVAILVFAAWILRIIFSTKPRSGLFDDLPTVLLYGPLYNTYSDDAAPFALIPAMLTFIRGVAFGAIQPSGIVQLVVLAICEVILILTLHAFRPFRSQTSMNAYHTFFASIRLIVVLLSIAFVPRLNIGGGSRGWIGYVILLLHAIVLVFGFWLNAIQRLIEVGARVLGAGGEDGTGAATRGGLVKAFGMRQLSRRARRPGFRNSMNSDAAILTDDGDAVDNKSAQYGSRSRSISASSAILLNQQSDRLSSHLERVHSGSGEGDQSIENNSFNFFPEAGAGASSSRRADPAVRAVDAGVPFYRAPRQRRPTGDLTAPGAKSRGSGASGDWINKTIEGGAEGPADKRDSTGRPLSFSPESKAGPSTYPRARENSDPILNDPNRPNVDYAVREVDFYYGVRGPALSNQPTRKLKTGPADPVGPVSSATGWFKGMFGRKTKESGKGFEVVRSSRAPPQRFAEDDSPPTYSEPFQDSPPPRTETPVLPGQKTRSTEDEEEHERDMTHDEIDRESAASPIDSEDETLGGSEEHYSSFTRPREVSDLAPRIGDIDTGGSIGIPSRFNSRDSRISNVSQQPRTARGQPTPSIPRKSSKRASQTEDTIFESSRLSVVPDAPEPRQSYSRQGRLTPQSRMPFSSHSPSDSHRHSLGAESALSIDADDTYLGADSSGTTTLAPPPSHQPDRPTSVGYVNQYRASDSITQGPARAGAAAEVVQDHSRQSSRGRISGISDRSEEYGW